MTILLVVLSLFIYLSYGGDKGKKSVKEINLVVKKVVDVVFLRSGNCVNIVADNVGVQLLPDLYYKISNKQAHIFCNNLDRYRKRFSEVKSVEYLDVEMIKGNLAEAVVRLKHNLPNTFTIVRLTVVRIGDRWYVLF